MPNMGRPTKCTTDLVAKMKRLLEEGAYPETALAVLGVSMDSHRRWMKQGEADLDAGEGTTFAAYAAGVDEGIARFQGYAATMFKQEYPMTIG